MYSICCSIDVIVKIRYGQLDHPVHIQAWLERRTLGCLNSTQRPEESRTRDHATSASPFLPSLSVAVLTSFWGSSCVRSPIDWPSLSKMGLTKNRAALLDAAGKRTSEKGRLFENLSGEEISRHYAGGLESRRCYCTFKFSNFNSEMVLKIVNFWFGGRLPSDQTF